MRELPLNTKIKKESWVYVVVQNPGGNEEFLGQHDQENNISFIPFFLDKDHANQCYVNLKREITQHYEVQAIIYEDLVRYAAEHQFLLYLLNETGKVLNVNTPE